MDFLNSAVSVNYDGLGNALHAIIVGNDPCIVQQHGEAELVQVGKFSKQALALPDIDGVNHYPFSGIVSGKFVQHRETISTWWAPGGPEVEHDDVLSAMAGQRHGLAIQLGQGKVRGHFTC